MRGSFGRVERRDLETAAIIRGKVDAPERQIARHVLEEVDQLEPGTDVVRGANQHRVVVETEQPEDEPADRVGGVVAVPLDLVPRLVLGLALVDPVALDQPQERLAREVELADRRLELPHHRPRRVAVVAGLDLTLQLVELCKPVALDLVARMSTRRAKP